MKKGLSNRKMTGALIIGKRLPRLNARRGKKLLKRKKSSKDIVDRRDFSEILSVIWGDQSMRNFL